MTANPLPSEPTPEMIEAGVRIWIGPHMEYPVADWPVWIRKTWDAMAAAAPSSPSPAGVEEMARELLATAYDETGQTGYARHIRSGAASWPWTAPALAAIQRALTLQSDGGTREVFNSGYNAGFHADGDYSPKSAWAAHISCGPHAAALSSQPPSSAEGER